MPNPTWLRCKLMLCTLTVGLLLWACASPPAAPVANKAVADSCGDGLGFVTEKAFFLKPGFDPDGVGQPRGVSGDHAAHPYRPPVRDGAVSEPYRADLAKAFDDAPHFLQKHLCKLDTLFIDRSPKGTDLGIWEQIDQRDDARQAKSYIIMSTQWWQPTNAQLKLVPLSVHETLLNNIFLPSSSILRYTSQQNDPSLTLLSILGHEIGHIVWYTELYERDHCNTFRGSSDVDFLKGSWSVVALPSRFHQASAKSASKVVSGPSAQLIVEAFTRNRRNRDDSPNPELARLVNDIYTSGTWFSLFSSAAPDEDFAETFKLLVLRNARDPLTNLSVEITGFPSVAVIKTDTSSLLSAKEACLAEQNLKQP